MGVPKDHECLFTISWHAMNILTKSNDLNGSTIIYGQPLEEKEHQKMNEILKKLVV